MGRYYSGDIEGKFWFGVQDSNDASFFGGEEYEPNYIEYTFGQEHLADIKTGITKCQKALGKYRILIKKYFSEGGEGYEGYTDKSLAKYLKVSKKKAIELLTWYARLGLGEKILLCVEENDICNFEAEL